MGSCLALIDGLCKFKARYVALLYSSYNVYQAAANLGRTSKISNSVGYPYISYLPHLLLELLLMQWRGNPMRASERNPFSMASIKYTKHRIPFFFFFF